MTSADVSPSSSRLTTSVITQPETVVARRICANPSCKVSFVPNRSTQKYHNDSCRLKWYKERYEEDKHRCPICGTLHAAPSKEGKEVK